MLSVTDKILDLQPVLVHGLGRSGSTLLMKLLGTSHEIAFDREPPCENLYLLYFLRLCGLLELDHQSEPEWQKSQLTDNLRERIGSLPWEDRSLLRTGEGEESFAISTMRGLWTQFSQVAAKNTHPADPHAVRFYAEKAAGWVVDFLSALGTGRTLRLVRDPRDIWLSVQAFDKKRGYYGFGRKEGMSKEDYLDVFLGMCQEHLEQVIASPNSNRNLLVRYEDLAIDLHAASERIGAWLGCKLDADQILGSDPTANTHVTSPSVSSSIARWKREMPRGEVQRFDEAMGDALGSFGYD